MNKKILLTISFAALMLAGCSNYSRKPYTEIPLAPGEPMAPVNEFCAFEDFPTDVPFQVRGVVKAAKKTYGSAESLRPVIMDKARRRGGNAVANYHENQRLGMWLWNLVRPVASGDAIIILNPRGKTCAEMGGYAL